MRKFLFSALVVAVGLFAVDALATVSPQGSNTFDWPSNTFNRLVFRNDSGNQYALNFMSGNFDVVLDASGNGAITYDSASTFSKVNVKKNGSDFQLNGFSVGGQMLVSNVTGTINPAGGGCSLTITMKIAFDGGGGLPASCKTSSFSVTVGTTKSTSDPAYNGIAYETTGGTLQAVAQDFNTGTVTAGNCTNQANADALNAFLGASYSPALFLNGKTTQLLTGSP
jgi:hypothetical protein